MKPFQLIQKRFVILGLSPNQSNQMTRLNGKMVGGFMFYGVGVIIVLVFLSNAASTFLEYTQSIYMLIAIIMNGLVFASAVFKMGKIFEATDSMGKYIERK